MQVRDFGNEIIGHSGRSQKRQRVTQSVSNAATRVAIVDRKVEVVVIPVSDVERAKAFAKLGRRLDQTPPCVVQFTPHGSGCSVQFGTKLTSATPSSGKGYT
jgi:hypothetical protein